jgi:splicing suppressor protein 51
MLVLRWDGQFPLPPGEVHIGTEFYKTPDLAAAFHSGFSADKQKDWYSTIKYLAHVQHPTLFTAARHGSLQYITDKHYKGGE